MSVTDKNTQRRAHTAVRAAIANGQLEPQPCERCGSLKVVAHHDDYSKPLDVMWLCYPHHRERHEELGLPMHPRGPRKQEPIRGPRLLTPRRVARLLGFKPRTITRWCRDGAFPEARHVGRVWRIPARDPYLRHLIELKRIEADGRS